MMSEASIILLYEALKSEGICPNLVVVTEEREGVADMNVERGDAMKLLQSFLLERSNAVDTPFAMPYFLYLDQTVEKRDKPKRGDGGCMYAIRERK